MRLPRAGRTLAIGAVGLAIALPLSSCGGGSTENTSANGLEKSNLTVAGLAVVDDAALYIAKDKGLFKKEGLNVTIKTLTQSTQAIPSMLRGDVDISAGGNYVSFFQAKLANTIDLRILAEGYLCDKDVIPVLTTESNIKKPADLKGKKVAVNLTNSVLGMSANAVLKSDNVDPSSVHYVQVPFPDMVPALQKGQVDAAVMVEPFATAASKQLGAHKVLDACSGPTDKEPLSGYMATNQFVEKNPKTVAAFQRAIKAAQGMAADRKVVEDALPTYTKIDKKTASVITIGNYPTSMKAERLQRVADLMKSAGILKSPLDVNKLIVQ
jgi:NitT/TauT family transport system substrate-binding protein